MPDYAAMYKVLFNSQTDAIKILQQAQITTEEMYVTAPDPELKVFPGDEKSGADKENS